VVVAAGVVVEAASAVVDTAGAAVVVAEALAVEHVLATTRSTALALVPGDGEQTVQSEATTIPKMPPPNTL
jgi:hypothetical protein